MTSMPKIDSRKVISQTKPSLGLNGYKKNQLAAEERCFKSWNSNAIDFNTTKSKINLLSHTL